MGVKKLEWAVSYSNSRGQILRNEYETEAKARVFYEKQKVVASSNMLPSPQFSKLRVRRWEAGFQDHQGRWKTRRFDTRKEAQEYHNEQVRAVQGRAYVDPKRSQNLTVAGLYELWIQRVATVGARGHRPATPKTVQGYEWLYERLIRPRWQDFPLSNISYSEVARWTQSMVGVDGTTASPNARARASKQLGRMLDFAVSQQILAVNPAKDSGGNRDYVPEVRPKRDAVYLTMRQLERLAACCPQYSMLIRFTGLTGLRWGEVTALQVHDLDLGPRPRVIVARAFAEVKGALLLGETKGHDSREVPLPSALVPDLERVIRGKHATALVFSSAEGKPMRNSNFARRHYMPARELAGSSVAALQRELGLSEHRRGLAYFGPETLGAVRARQKERGLDQTGLVDASFWRTITVAGAGQGIGGNYQRLAGFTLREGDQDFRSPVFHDLRHTAVSLYLSVTKNVKHVQRIAGHKDATTTLNTYADLFDDDFYNSAESLTSLMVG